MKAFAWIATVFASKAPQAAVGEVTELATQDLQQVAGGLPRVGGFEVVTEPALVASVPVVSAD